MSAITKCGVRSATRVDQFVVREYDLRAGYRMARHAHARPGLVLVQDGEFAFHTGHATQVVHTGEALAAPDAWSHGEEAGARGARCFIVESGNGTFRLPRAEHTPRLDPVIARCGGLLERAMRVDGRHGKRAAALIARVAYARFCGAPAEGPPPWLLDAWSALEESCPNGTLVGAVADAQSVSREHLARTFKTFFGCTATEYVQSRRLELCTSRLRTSDEPISAIAHEAGFADHSHLNRVFRARFGMSPGAYRRWVRRGRPAQSGRTRRRNAS